MCKKNRTNFTVGNGFIWLHLMLSVQCGDLKTSIIQKSWSQLYHCGYGPTNSDCNNNKFNCKRIHNKTKNYYKINYILYVQIYHRNKNDTTLYQQWKGEDSRTQNVQSHYVKTPFLSADLFLYQGNIFFYTGF